MYTTWVITLGPLYPGGEGRPWVHIRRGGIADDRTVQGAVEACRLLGPGYDLMSNNEWQTVVSNVAYVDLGPTNAATTTINAQPGTRHEA